MKKRFGDTKTHLDLTEKARRAYDEFSPLSIYEIETDDGYTYDITGCVQATGLTEDEVNETLEGLIPMYRVKDEFIDSWYGNQSTDEIAASQSAGFDYDEIKRLAADWGTDIDDLMEQVEEI